MTGLADNSLPTAFLTCLIVADPLGCPMGVAEGAADSTFGRASSILEATLFMEVFRASDNVNTVAELI